MRFNRSTSCAFTATLRLAAFASLFLLCPATVTAGFIPEEFDEALQLPEEFSQNATAREHVRRAIELFRQQEHDAALAQLQLAHEALPTLPPSKIMLARLWLATGKIAPARELLEQLAAESGAEPHVYLTFGELALHQGRVTDAALHFQKLQSLVAKRPTDGSLDRQSVRLRSQAHAGLAAVAEARRDWPSAARELAAWLELEPENARARQRWGRALFQLGEMKKAFAALQQAAQNQETIEPAPVAMAWLSLHTGDQAKATEWMAYAEQTEPENPRVQRALVDWHLQAGRGEAAERHLQRLTELAPEQPDLDWLRGTVARMRGDYLTAERHFESLSRQSPGDFAVANQLALVLVEQADESKRRRALQLAEVNARQYPRNPQALATLGWVLYQQGRLDEAEKLLQTAVSGGQASSETAYYLAHLAADRGRPQEAQALLEGAVQSTGLFPQRADAQRWLATLTARPAADLPTASP